MNNFFTCIVKSNGEVSWKVEINSHDILVQHNGLSTVICEKDKLQFAYVKISCDDIFEKDLKKWKLKFDDDEPKPTWWSKIHETKAYEALKIYLGNYILEGVTIEVLKDTYIMAARNVIIKDMYGNSRIKDMCGKSEVENMRDECTIENTRDHCVIETMRNCSRILNARDHSVIGDMWGDSSIYDMWDASIVKYMWDDSIVYDVRGNCKVENMREYSKIINTWDNCIIENMENNSKILSMRGNSKVISMYDNSDIKHKWGLQYN